MVLTTGRCRHWRIGKKLPEAWKARFEEMKKVRGSGFSIVEEIEDPSQKSGIKKVGKL
jgi:hypothetical protein